MNYYNEHDPKAAAWLRELIAAGEIPAGDVDTRSITEIKPHELTGYIQCHFFAGIAGWSLALALAGWPASRPVWTGSCPCQPFSAAGQGKGASDDRHLWPVFASLIAACRPERVFGEQVAQAVGFGWLDGVCADLGAQGYTVGAAVLGAHSVGAPHIRQRLYWVADSTRGQREQRIRPQGNIIQRSADDGATGGMDNPAMPRLIATGERPELREERGRECVSGEGCAVGWMGDTIGAGQRGRDKRGLGASGGEVGEPQDRESPANESGNGREDALRVADSKGDRIRPIAGSGTSEDGKEKAGRNTNGGSGDVGSCCRDGWSRFEIVHCRDGKARRFEPGSFPLADGLPGRVGLLRGYGNAIVPQVAAEFIQAFNDINLA